MTPIIHQSSHQLSLRPLINLNLSGATNYKDITIKLSKYSKIIECSELFSRLGVR